MYAYLTFLALGSTLVLFPPTALADSQAVVAASLEYQGNPEPIQINERKVRATLAASSLGLVLSTLGIIAGVAMVRVPDCRWQGGDYCRAVPGAEKKRRAGKALLVISPIALGASIFGIVRAHRIRKEARPQTNEPREPTSWRGTQD